MLELILKDISDNYVRENFFRIAKYFKKLVFANETFRVFNVDIREASPKLSLKHGLSFIPEDVVVTRIEGDFNFYFRFQEFDRENLYITAAGPVKLKFLAGSFDNELRRNAVGATYPLVPPA